MELFYYLFVDGIVEKCVQGIPMILAFLHLKIFKLPIKVTAVTLSLNLLVSIFFWVKLADLDLALWQGYVYFCTFTWLLVENIYQKTKKKDSATQADINNNDI